MFRGDARSNFNFFRLRMVASHLSPLSGEHVACQLQRLIQPLARGHQPQTSDILLLQVTLRMTLHFHQVRS